MIGIIARSVRRLLHKNDDVHFETPEWYRSQGNNLTNCGDAVINMICVLLGLPERNFDNVFIWSMKNINEYLFDYVTDSELYSFNEFKSLPTNGDCFVMTISGLAIAPHFVLVRKLENDDQNVLVADPLTGCRIQSWESFRNEIFYNIYIKVW